ncbi:hypothetical protein NDU88_005188 [Pleurodeles waltl]|uniref:Uncharacterized protein n=1 Tax=Pleurodeles waltl TaxID=8319 RepID=A0AAV7LBU1_PLEWA|nr:hypothetical protein NDU88_005188 [Pleurodeles waltl]
MSAAIKHQADKQDIQVDLLNIMDKYIVSIDLKLQTLNDLIHQAQEHTYMQQAVCNSTTSGDKPQVISSILNQILLKVRSQALNTKERFRVLELEEREEKNVIMETSPREPLIPISLQKEGMQSPEGINPPHKEAHYIGKTSRVQAPPRQWKQTPFTVLHKVRRPKKLKGKEEAEKSTEKRKYCPAEKYMATLRTMKTAVLAKHQ